MLELESWITTPGKAYLFCQDILTVPQALFLLSLRVCVYVHVCVYVCIAVCICLALFLVKYVFLSRNLSRIIL